MRFLVGLASCILGVALLAGYVYRDKPAVADLSGADTSQSFAQHNVKAPSATTGSVTAVDHVKTAEKIAAPDLVGKLAEAQPTILNADRSRFAPATSAPAPVLVTQDEPKRAHRVLVMALQGELRRAGCYEGAVNGNWGVASKAAMYWFLKRANAKLPVNKPDQAQLSLLKSVENDYCAKKEIEPDFVTKVTPVDEVRDGVPNPTARIQGNAFGAARQRAGLPTNGDVGLDGAATATASDDAVLPAPMAVGTNVIVKKKRRYRPSRSRQVENLFKHPLGRF